MEILVVLLIFSLLSLALLRFIGSGFSVSRSVLLQQQAVEDARLQLKRISRSLREARPGAGGEYSLADMQPQRMIYFADVDGDSAVERVRYELSGTDLLRGVVEPEGDPPEYILANEEVTVVSRNIRNASEPVFVFYSGNFPADTTELTPVDVTEVKHIKFYLRIDVNPDVEPDEVVVQSEVQLRNLKDNLGDV